MQETHDKVWEQCGLTDWCNCSKDNDLINILDQRDIEISAEIMSRCDQCDQGLREHQIRTRLADICMYCFGSGWLLMRLVGSV